jgi:hypothetical protein
MVTPFANVKFEISILHCLVFLRSECGTVNLSARRYAPSHLYVVDHSQPQELDCRGTHCKFYMHQYIFQWLILPAFSVYFQCSATW